MSDKPEARHESCREKLYSIVSDEDKSLTEKERAIVSLGTEYFDVELGFVSDIEDDEFEVRVSTADDFLPEGDTYPLSETFCRRCVETESALAVSNAIEEGWVGDPAYVEREFGCYLGTPIRVDDEIVGTLCFADHETREDGFSATERAFVELAARLLGREREITQFERELQRRDRDIDRREEELDRTERKYESLVTTAPDAIFIADIETGEIIEANEKVVDLVGLSREAIEGRNLSEFHPGKKGRHWAEFQRFVKRGEGTKSRYDNGSQIYVEASDGSKIPVEISTGLVELDGTEYVQGIVRDISDRRERERELRIKDRAIEKAPVGISISDPESSDHGLMYLNERFEEITGYDREVFLGENCRILQGPRTDEAAIDELRAAIEEKRQVRTTLLNYRADGTPFWNEVSIAPIEDDSGDVSHYIGFQRDVTERKRKEELVNVLNRVLRHNLRNGTSVILTRARQLIKRLDAEDRDRLEAIQRRAKRLTALGEQARAINDAVSTETTAEARDIVPIVREVATQLQSAHPDANISVDTPERQDIFATDTIKAALEELGTNASKHAGPSPTVEFEVVTGDEWIDVRVHDDGPGLPPEEQTVLDRGYETPLKHGSGLGLWFVNWVVTGVGGQVSATVDDGTTITLSLRDPCDADAEVMARQQSAFSE